ncbi:hypothetical protein [Pseudogemmobacter humi]|uniref:hypothetical protein n=1 Tax=Pseudogemmobacter humi TaxID=2483812 RepID=UPI000F543E44|nr:hypothetical protein [Pseudogemmobacter humi]
MTHDDEGAIYYLTIQPGGDNANAARRIHLCKVSGDGENTVVSELNGKTLGDKATPWDAVDISKSDDFVADMSYSNGRLGPHERAAAAKGRRRSSAPERRDLRF